SQELKTFSYHKLYDILKQHQHEVNEIRAEKIVRVANPLALVAQQQPDNSPRINRNAGYKSQRIGNVAGARETVDVHNVLIESMDMNYDSEQIDQNDEDADIAKERELLASLIEKLKCEIDETKNRNTLLETSNKVLVEKLKSEIEDFKNKNNNLELSNNQFKEANNKLSEENDLLYADFKKSQAELKRRNSIEYASEMEIECAK
nr:hypothetical protein [Tanacetum cinerariifolium]